MTYKTKLLSLVRHVVEDELAARSLVDEILTLNHGTLELGRERLYESGLTITGTAALAKTQKEIGNG